MMVADLFVSIDLSLGSTSISAEEIGKPRSLSPSGQCCGPSKPAETTMPVKESEGEHASVRAHASNTQLLPNQDGGARRRERVKRFVAEKGPRIAGAAAAIGMFIFNVVTSCS